MKNVRVVGHQGDVVIMEVDSFPEGDRLKDKQCENAILAYGEATGHAHQFETLEDVEVFKMPAYPNLMFIDPKREARLMHGKARDFIGTEADHDYHNVIVLDPNKKYISGIVEETDWINKVTRQVVD